MHIYIYSIYVYIHTQIYMYIHTQIYTNIIILLALEKLYYCIDNALFFPLAKGMLSNYFDTRNSYQRILDRTSFASHTLNK